MKFADIPGLAKVKNELIQTVATGRIPHAQMFYGEDGGASLSLALAYAQYTACDHRTETDSCGKCPSCVQHASMSHPDLHFTYPAGKSTSNKTGTCKSYLPQWREMLADSPFPTSSQWNVYAGLEGKFLQIGVAESKEILGDFSLKSYSGGYKILILWMPEVLHTSASNKLLKFIEEPEPGSLILMVSHNAEKVLGTILSRTQQTRIPKHSFEELVEYLIHSQNKTQSEAEVAALASNGNIGEALDILKNPERELGFAHDFVQWMRFAVMANLPELVKFSEAMAKKNKDAARDFLKFSLRIIDHCLQLRFLNKPTGDAIFEPAGFKIEKFAPYIKPANAEIFYREMNTAIYEMERNVNPKFIWLDMSVELSKALRIK